MKGAALVTAEAAASAALSACGLPKNVEAYIKADEARKAKIEEEEKKVEKTRAAKYSIKARPPTETPKPKSSLAEGLAEKLGHDNFEFIAGVQGQFKVKKETDWLNLRSLPVADGDENWVSSFKSGEETPCVLAVLRMEEAGSVYHWLVFDSLDVYARIASYDSQRKVNVDVPEEKRIFTSQEKQRFYIFACLQKNDEVYLDPA